MQPRGPDAARDKVEDLRFAVELKFLVRHTRDHATDPAIRSFVPHLPPESQGSITELELGLFQDRWKSIAQALDALADVDALAGHDIDSDGSGYTNYWKTHWIVYKSNSAVPPYLKYQNDNPHLLLPDTTHPDYDNHEKYIWIPVEVCSPLLSWSVSEGDATGLSSLQHLEKVLETINDGKCGTVSVNHSTETHVHVGRVDATFLSLATFKRLATLAWLSEPILRGVKDPKSPNVDHVYTWSSPLKTYSRLGMALQAQQENIQPASDAGYDAILQDLSQRGDSGEFDGFVAGICRALDAKGTPTAPADREDDSDLTAGLLNASDRRALHMIWKARSHQELGRMLSGTERKYRRLGFNFHALERDAGEETGSATSPRTIEFRFLEGFVGTQVVLAWVQLCRELVALAAKQVDGGEFYAVVAALLLTLAEHSPLHVKFQRLMEAFGEDLMPRSVWEPLQKIIEKNYPPSDTAVHHTYLLPGGVSYLGWDRRHDAGRPSA